MLNRVRNFFGKLYSDQRGAMSVEKILILALIALPIVIVLFIFRQTIVDWFRDQEEQLQPTGTP